MKKDVDKPSHPLVVDNATGLCRYATQVDVHRLESVAIAYESLIRDMRERVATADRLMQYLKQEYGSNRQE